MVDDLRLGAPKGAIAKYFSQDLEGGRDGGWSRAHGGVVMEEWLWGLRK
jgi:hypothetical protein